MIVQCGNCQTRFRVADERVTPRGLKVRCSRCGQVFIARSAGDAAPVEPVAPHRVVAGPGSLAPAQERLDSGFLSDVRQPAPTTKIAAAPSAATTRPVLPAPEWPASAPAAVPGLELEGPRGEVASADPGLELERPRADIDSFAGWAPPPSPGPASPSRPPPFDVAPVPGLPGLPGVPQAEPARGASAAARDEAPASPVSASPAARRAPWTPRRRERPPSGGPVAVAHVVIGAGLLLAAVLAVAASLAPEVPGEGALPRALRVLAGDAGAAPDLLPGEVHAGVRETLAGGRVLVVGGTVRGARSVPPTTILVRAEVIAPGGTVLARAEAPAGWKPTEDRVDRATGGDVPPPTALAAGGEVPFLVVIGEPPAGLEAALVRVTARPGPAAPAPGVSEASP